MLIAARSSQDWLAAYVQPRARDRNRFRLLWYPLQEHQRDFASDPVKLGFYPAFPRRLQCVLRFAYCL
jgi:hypothetical protein